MARLGIVATPLCLFAASPRASAHANADIGGFYQGLGTVFMHWNVLLLCVAAGLWIAQHPLPRWPKLGTTLIASFGAGFMLAMVGAHVLMPELVSSSAFTIAGLLAAMQAIQLPRLNLGLAAAIGAMSGLALSTLELNTLQQPLLFISGTLTGAGMLVFYIVAAVSRLPAGWPWIGVRIVGSWIAAVGLMVCAYSWQALE